MDYKKWLIVRIFILCCIACLSGWVLTLDQFWATKLLLILIFAGMVGEMLHYAVNPLKRITFFMESFNDSNDFPLFIPLAKDDTENIFRRFIEIVQQIKLREETEAWQKIIRILAHEIINSTSPINMLTDSLGKIAQKEYWTEEDRRNMETGLQTIGKRSRGMTSFVESYRTITSTPMPVYGLTNMDSLLQRIVLLFAEEASTITASTSGKMIIQTDERLLEQVLINLVRNAIDASDKLQAYIEIKASCDLRKLVLEVRDNGCGISPQNIENVFTPFFTTRKTGTGIGLFISRKIVQSLRGTITIQSVQGKGTTVCLQMPVV